MPAHFGFTPKEHRISVLPSAIASMIVLFLIIFNGGILWPVSPAKSHMLFGVGLLGIIYTVIFSLIVIPSSNINPRNNWINAFAVALSLGMLAYTTPSDLDIYIGVLLILDAISSSITSERGPTYTMVVATILGIYIIRHDFKLSFITLYASVLVVAVIAIETIWQLKSLSRNHIRRLEIITEFSRQIASTLEKKQVVSLLSDALLKAVEADSYFIGLREGNNLRLDLIFDDGEYYENQIVPIDGTLSGWVLNNQQSLFLPDLRKEVVLPGVRLVLLGKHKTSLSWMGVPMSSGNIDGIISIGSYRPNAFNRADMDLLSSLALHAAQTLHNANHHAEVELQAKLDSLTGVYNHGHFLKLLKEQSDRALEQKKFLSLIMLDIDYFKQYNDTYGHLIGDEILIKLCNIIRQHIKSTDAVGRWGGEEFAISLPSADAEHAHKIAKRIQRSMQELTMYSNGETIPVPTVSQGIAIFSVEVDNPTELIDLADQRLYVAKERGRNQIEPPETYWSKLKTK
jgi:diguanylate cyclase (GGDEF)-like protein